MHLQRNRVVRNLCNMEWSMAEAAVIAIMIGMVIIGTFVPANHCIKFPR
jgi:hypothetical protein